MMNTFNEIRTTSKREHLRATADVLLAPSCDNIRNKDNQEIKLKEALFEFLASVD